MMCLFFRLKSCQTVYFLSSPLSFSSRSGGGTIQKYSYISTYYIKIKILAHLLHKEKRFCSPSSKPLPRVQGYGVLSSPTKHPENGKPNQKAPFLSGGLFGLSGVFIRPGRRTHGGNPTVCATPYRRPPIRPCRYPPRTHRSPAPVPPEIFPRRCWSRPRRDTPDRNDADFRPETP